MALKPYRVVPNKSGKKTRWEVKRTGAARSASSHTKKSAAIKKAKRIAKRNRVGVIVHRANGTVQRGFTYQKLCK